jgi:uncharacterized coiled-coil DUF342 family protein
MEREEKHIDFYHDCNDCPTCKQSIDTDFKTNMVDQHKEKIVEYQDAINKINVKIDECLDRISKADKLQPKLNELDTRINSGNLRIESLQSNQVSTGSHQ